MQIAQGFRRDVEVASHLPIMLLVNSLLKLSLHQEAYSAIHRESMIVPLELPGEILAITVEMGPFQVTEVMGRAFETKLFN